jgi:hypothetical protein
MLDHNILDRKEPTLISKGLATVQLFCITCSLYLNTPLYG